MHVGIYLCVCDKGSPEVTFPFITNWSPLVGVLSSVGHEDPQSQPGLLGGGEDLIGREDEAVAASVSQLKGVGVLDAFLVRPVHSGATCLI